MSWSLAAPDKPRRFPQRDSKINGGHARWPGLKALMHPKVLLWVLAYALLNRLIRGPRVLLDITARKRCERLAKSDFIAAPIGLLPDIARYDLGMSRTRQSAYGVQCSGGNAKKGGKYTTALPKILIWKIVKAAPFFQCL